jgi:ParB-like chromosome segregation protein Spo0J
VALKDLLKRVKLKDLNPAKYNPNEMDITERRLLKQSLEHYGYIENIVVNKDYTIIDGHHRVEELIEAGTLEEDVVVLDLSKDEEKALNLALRRIKGKADPELELKIIEDLTLKGFDVELAGFTSESLQELAVGLDFGEIPDPEDHEKIPEKKPKTITCPHCGEDFDINS